MKIARILFAGALFSSAIFAQQGDPGAAERFRMKFGRSTAAQELKSNPSEQPQKVNSATCDCCHHKHV
jgi:hypothetical protein